MDLRIALVIFLSVVIAGVIRAWWARFVEKHEARPVPLKLKNGVYVPWGPLQRARRVLHILFLLWLAHLLFWVAALVWVKAITPLIAG